MKYVKFRLEICVIAAALAGCAKSTTGVATAKTSPDSSTPTPLTTPPKVLSYELFSKVGQSTCTTGKKEFKTTHEMCLKIQDEEFNMMCALAGRVDFFKKNCAPLGYKFNESFYCTVTALREGVPTPAFNLGTTNIDDISYQDILLRTTICRGESLSSGKHRDTSDSYSHWEYLNKQYKYEFTALYTPSTVTDRNIDRLKNNFISVSFKTLDGENALDSLDIRDNSENFTFSPESGDEETKISGHLKNSKIYFDIFCSKIPYCHPDVYSQQN